MVVPNKEPDIVNNCSSPNDGKQRLRERFQVIKKLGQGTYGKVQLAVNRETKQEVAIKTIRKAKIENEQDLLRIRREIQIMSSIQHPHIIHIYEVFENSDKIVLVMQYASGGELYDYLGCHKKLLEKEARRIFRQVAAAVYYCHKNKICHRDLKLENILLDDKGNAKIADFGLSNVFDERKKLRTFCGSPLYASPEIVKGTPYCGPEVDCWSLGVLLYTMVYGAMPFDGSNFKRLVKQISEGVYYEPKIKSKASGIIKRLLTVDVAVRATIKDICVDEWVNETYDHSLLKVANDMACLTPVSVNTLSHLHALESKVDARISHPKNSPLQTNHNVGQELESIMKLTCNELTKLNSIAGKKQITMPCSNSDSFDGNLPPPNSLHCNNETLSEIDFLNANENDCEAIKTASKSNLTSQSQICSFMSVLGHEDLTEQPEPLSCDSQQLPASNSIDFDGSEIKKNGLGFNQPEKALLPTSEFEAEVCQSENLRTKYLTSDKEFCFPDNIPNCVEDSTSGRRSTVEQFRAWRASLDQQKKNESDSILPIFDVTSVIPKRKNVKKDPESEEKCIPNGIIETNKCNSNISNTHMSLDTNEMHINEVVLETSATSTVSNTCSAVDPTSSTGFNEQKVTRQRKEVIQLLNQACTQGKVSTEMKRQFVSALTSQNSHGKKNDYDTSSAQVENISCKRAEKISAQCTEPLEESSLENSEAISEVQEVSPPESQIEPIENSALITQSLVEEKLTTETRSDMPEKKEVNSETTSDEKLLLSNEQSCSSGNKGKVESGEFVRKENMIISESNVEKPVEAYGLKPNGTVQNISKDDETKGNPSKVIGDDFSKLQAQISYNESCLIHRSQQKRQSRSHSMQKLKTRSYSADNDSKTGDLERILRRPRKYSLCALLAASFELERLAAVRTRRYSESSKRLPGRIIIPRSFDPSSESEASTPVDKKDIILIPTVTVAENKEKIEKKIEKVKLSALSMKPRRKSEAGTRKKLKKYTRSCTEVFPRMGTLSSGQSTMQIDDDLSNESIARYSISYPSIYNDGNKTASEIEFRYGDIRYLGEEIEECISAENVEFGSSKYVPITRCCKKMTFPPKSVEFADNNKNERNMLKRKNGCIINESRNHEQDFASALQQDQRIEDAGDTNSENSIDAITRKVSRSNKTNNNKKSLLNSDSWNSSSNEKDSSDNDDELDSISFDSRLEECESEDLWNFLKTINNTLGVRLKKAQRHSTKSNKFSRSKSQECRASENHCVMEKFLTRSHSKEEKHNSPNSAAVSCSSQETCESSSLSDFNRTPSKELTGSLANVEDEKLSNNPLRCFQNTNCSLAANLQEESFQNRAKKKYYSLSNLSDSRSFLYENNLCDMKDRKSLESFGTVQVLCDDTTERNPVDKTADDNSSQEKDSISACGSLRSIQVSKDKRSQSYMMLNGDKDCDESFLKRHAMALSQADFTTQDIGSTFAARNKALSDLNLSYREATCNSEFPSTVCSSDTKKIGSLRFAKSLGSKLNLEPRSILLESSSKYQTMQSRNKKKDDSLLRKRGRKVSFIGDFSKEEHANFALESLAKAQVALSNIDREYVADKTDEDKGTLLEALKTQGYKNIMSQRLQQCEDDEDDELFNNRYSLACLLKLKNYNIEGIPFDILHTRNIMDHIQCAKRMQWNKNYICPLDDVSNDYNELEYTDLLNLNGIYDGKTHQTADINWSQFPNSGLYQSVTNFRPHRTANDETTPTNWEELDFNDWLAHRKSEKHFVSNRDNFYDPKTTPSNIRENNTQKKCHVSEFEPRAGRNTASPMEKLSTKIKALKNRCHQKSLDESTFNRSTSIDSEDNFDSTVRNSDSLISSELSDSDKPGESVSDRIWRKSFYSRFNETPTLRRRRSMLFESDFSQSPLTLKSFKRRSTPDSKEPPNRPSEKELGSLLFMEKGTVSNTNYKGDDVSTQGVMEQNIPNHINTDRGEENVVSNAMQEGD